MNLYMEIISLLGEIKPYDDIDEDTELITSRILDSLSIFALVTLLEDKFEIEIPDEAITRENFSSVKIIAGLLSTYRVSI